MAFKPVNTQTIDLKKHKDKPFIGTYLGNEAKKGNYGEEIIWKFADEDEAPFSVYGFTMLNRQMALLKPGLLCRLTYLGTEKVQTKKFGMKDVHQVKVEVDSGDEAGNGHKKPDMIDQFSDGSPVPEELPY